MAIQMSVAVRDARLDAIQTQIGTSAVLKIFTGSPPSTCASGDSGSLLVTQSLPSSWMAAASSGSKALSGTWTEAAADGSGTAGYFRLYASNGTTCGIQGTVTATGGGGDMTLDNASIATGQTVTITAFTLTDANA